MTTYSYNIRLTDYTFIALRNLLKEECEKIKQQHGIVAYDEETGEAKHPFGDILNAMRTAVEGAELQSFYTPPSANS